MATSFDPAMRGQGRGRGRGRGGRDGLGGGSSNWREEVRLRISQEAEGFGRSPPPCFRRLDAFGNQDHPSIFKRGQKTSQHVAIDVVGTSATNAPASGCGGDGGAKSPQQLSAGTRDDPAGGQMTESTMDMATGRDPVVVAVGPYHQRLSLPPPLRTPPLTSRAKKCRIVMFLAEHFGLDAADFLGWALNKEAKARGCYERDSFAMDPKEMAEMLLLDGCLLLFCVFLLRKSVCEDQLLAELTRNETYGKDFIYLSADISLHMKQTRLDLLMLYNQIPFFVLAELHRRLKGTLFEKINHSIEELALSCFNDIHPTCRFTCWPPPPPPQRDAHGGGAAAANDQFPVPVPVQTPPAPKVHHLLHLFHLSRVPRGKHEVGISSIVPKEPEHHLPCVTELKESLTRVRKKKKKSHTAGRCDYDDYPLDISFERRMLGTCAVLSIPELCIHNYSDCVFRSLIAFEQNHLRCGLGVTAYAICMSWLLRSEADVKVLRKKGILMHTQKNDKEIVDFFRGLRDEYADTCLPEDLLALGKQVTAHQRSRPAAVVKRVGRQCFPRQTVTFFVIVGTIISLATLVNTIHTMYRYYHPFKGANPLYGH